MPETRLIRGHDLLLLVCMDGLLVLLVMTKGHDLVQQLFQALYLSRTLSLMYSSLYKIQQLCMNSISLVPRPLEGRGKAAWYLLHAHAPNTPPKHGAPRTTVYHLYAQTKYGAAWN